MIEVDYNPESRMAMLFPGVDTVARSQFDTIRFAFENLDVEVTAINAAKGFEIAWHEFLLHRKNFGDILKQIDIGFAFTPKARDRFEEFLTKRNSRMNRESSTVPKEEIQAKLNALGFKRELKWYQIRNLSSVSGLNSAATFTVPGGGKTTLAIAWFDLNKAQDEILLIVCPRNAFQTWEVELPECNAVYKEMSIKRLTGGREAIQRIIDQGPDVALITYDQIRFVPDLVSDLLMNNSVCMMLDESHKMKAGQDGQTGRTLLNLAHLADRKLILSGTPMPNSDSDLIAQYNFLFEGEQADELNVVNRFQPYFVRTTKADLNIGEPQIVRYEVDLLPRHRELYSLLTDRAIRRLSQLNLRDRSHLERASRCVQYLLQAASNPLLLLNSNFADGLDMEPLISQGIPSKIETAVKIATDLVSQDQKVLIWSNFVKSVEHVSQLLGDASEYIHGKIPTDDNPDNPNSRESIIRRFNDPDSQTRVLVANPAACSEAISLHHVCHHAIYLDRNYNAAQFLQSQDRIHRIGIPKNIDTIITLLHTPNSIDDAVEARLNRKLQRMGTALNDPSLKLTPLSLDSQQQNANVSGMNTDDLDHLVRHLLNNRR